jgi:hypothetical protein
MLEVGGRFAPEPTMHILKTWEGELIANYATLEDAKQAGLEHSRTHGKPVKIHSGHLVVTTGLTPDGVWDLGPQRVEPSARENPLAE